MAKVDTRNNIMSAAIQLFGTLGYTDTTTKMIATKAKCNEVTIFRHFSTKENLFQEALMFYTDKIDLSKQLPKLVKLHPSDVMKYIGTNFLKQCYANKIVYKIQMKLQDDILGIHKMQLTKSYIAGLTTYLALLEKKGEFDGDPKKTAQNYILSILGIFTFYVLANQLSDDDVTILVNDTIDNFINLCKFN